MIEGAPIAIRRVVTSRYRCTPSFSIVPSRCECTSSTSQAVPKHMDSETWSIPWRQTLPFVGGLWLWDIVASLLKPVERIS